MTVEWVVLVLARWLNLSAAAGLFGFCLFPLYVSNAARRDFIERPSSRWLIFTTSAMVLVSSVAWAGATLVNMEGSWSALLDRDAWSDFLFGTSFGAAWIVRLTLALAMLPAIAGVNERIMPLTAVSLSAVLLISQAWVGHVASLPTPAKWGVAVAYALHVLGAGAWFGGLAALAMAMSGLRGDTASALRSDEEVLARFSWLGIIAVAAIAVGGVVNAMAESEASVSILVATRWGQVLVAKVALVTIMLLLACMNRFFLMPRLAKGEVSAHEALVRSVLAEQVLGWLVLGLTAALGALAPVS